MISTRDEFLSAIRRADLTPQGITIGPVAFVDGKNINLGKVTDERSRRELIQRTQLAPSKYFAANTLWILPGGPTCSDAIPF